MKKSIMKATFKSDIEKVWSVVTDNDNYQWRSDLSRIEVNKDHNSFVEYTSNGFATNFTITEKRPYTLYKFNMNNKNMNGHWCGKFKKLDNGTEIEFTEEVSVNNPIMNLFASLYLKKQQKLYVSDLKKALGE